MAYLRAENQDFFVEIAARGDLSGPSGQDRRRQGTPNYSVGTAPRRLAAVIATPPRLQRHGGRQAQQDQFEKPVTNLFALGFVQAVDGAVDGQCGEGPFLEQNVTRSVTPELLAAF